MNGPTEQDLRTALRELADEARATTNLADAARTRGRRLRRRRRLAMTGGALAALVALAAPFVWLRPTTPEPGPAAWVPPSSSAAPSPSRIPAPAGDWTQSPLTLPGGWLLVGATPTGTSYTQNGERITHQGYALDRAHHQYVSTDQYDEIWASPSGEVAGVVDYDRPGEFGLLDLDSGVVRWVRIGQHGMTPQWSPDGSRIALTIFDKASGDRFLGVLSATGEWRMFPVDYERYFCTDSCYFTWTRDGREVVWQQTDPTAPRSEATPHIRRGVQLFSPDDGRPTRFLPIKGDPTGPWSWSPDGQRVVVKGPRGPEIIEVATGRVLGPTASAEAVWGPDNRLLYRDRLTGEMVLIDLYGRELVRQALPGEVGQLPIVLVAPR